MEDKKQLEDNDLKEIENNYYENQAFDLIENEMPFNYIDMYKQPNDYEIEIKKRKTIEYPHKDPYLYNLEEIISNINNYLSKVKMNITSIENYTKKFENTVVYA